jgi:hypothetical protein
MHAIASTTGAGAWAPRSRTILFTENAAKRVASLCELRIARCKRSEWYTALSTASPGASPFSAAV